MVVQLERKLIDIFAEKPRNSLAIAEFSHNTLFSNGNILFYLLVVLFMHIGTENALAESNRGYDPDMLLKGQTLYQNNCAVCHGVSAQSTVKNWQQRDQNGNMPPPPLNGTAHTWHHPLPGLMHTIKNGTQSIGGNMPSWKDTLDDEEIFSIIVWLTFLWPDEIFAAWMQRNKQ